MIMGYHGTIWASMGFGRIPGVKPSIVYKPLSLTKGYDRPPKPLVSIAKRPAERHEESRSRLDPRALWLARLTRPGRPQRHDGGRPRTPRRLSSAAAAQVFESPRSMGKEIASWPVSRVLYGSGPRAGTWQPFIWDRTCARPLATHPDDRPGNGLNGLRRSRHPYSVLLPVGFAVPSMLPCPRWALTPPFHPCLRKRRRSALCGTFPGVAPAGRYPAPCFRGARTFLPPRPFGACGERLPGQLALRSLAKAQSHGQRFQQDVQGSRRPGYRKRTEKSVS